MAIKLKIQPPVLIYGLGKSGLSAKKWLLALGLSSSDIKTYDEHKDDADFKSESDLKGFSPSTVVVSPGVSLSKSVLQNLRSAGAQILSEIDLATLGLDSERIIAITGSLGKSTTTSLIAHGIKSFDAHVFAGGNLGTPLCDYVLSVKNGHRKRAQWIVLELSSYQLENCDFLKIDYGVITFLSPNHLERYADLNHYYSVKWSLVARSRYFVLLNKNGGDLISFSKTNPSEKTVWASREDLEPEYRNNLQLLGDHNLDNLSVAVALGKALHFQNNYFSALLSFPGLPHRLENLGVRKGLFIINDSKATTMDSVKAATEAVETFKPTVPLFILLGGRDKKLPWEELKIFFQNRSHKFLFFGEYGSKIQQKISQPGPVFEKLSELLSYLDSDDFLESLETTSNSISAKILFSPGGVSQDEFQSFEHRGDFLKKWFES